MNSLLINCALVRERVNETLLDMGTSGGDQQFDAAASVADMNMCADAQHVCWSYFDSVVFFACFRLCQRLCGFCFGTGNHIYHIICSIVYS